MFKAKSLYYYGSGGAQMKSSSEKAPGNDKNKKVGRSLPKRGKKKTKNSIKNTATGNKVTSNKSSTGGSKKKTKKRIISYNKKGGNQNGPYAALVNKNSAYERLGAPGVKEWVNGMNIQGSGIGGPTPLACPSSKGMYQYANIPDHSIRTPELSNIQIGSRKNKKPFRKYLFK